MVKRLISIASALLLSLSSLFVFAPMIASAAVDVCTWDGSTNTNWNTAANWTCATDGEAVPGTGDSLVFDNTGKTGAALTLNNDITGGSFNDITFSGTGIGQFTIGGNSLTLTGNISITSDAGDAAIQAPLVISGDKTLNYDGYLSLSGNLSGSGAITKSGTGTLVLDGDNSSYTGALTVNSGSVSATAKGLAGTGGRIFNAGSDLNWGDCDTSTYVGDITLNGASSVPTGPGGSAGIPKLYTYTGCTAGGGGADETYGSAVRSGMITLNGYVSLGSDVTFNSYAKTTKITGAFTGNHKFVIDPGSAATLQVASDDNSSAMPNGTYTSEVLSKTLTDSTTTNIGIFGNSVITINGKRGDTTVTEGATLKGNGTVGNLSVTAGGTVSPGNSPGCLSTSNLSLLGNYTIELSGTDACTGYDQLKVTGTVDVTNAIPTATFVNNYHPKANASYVVINNDGTDKVTGTFKDLAEGATFKTASGSVLKVSYVGGDGNDVTLTVISVGTPDTGFGMILNSPITVLAGATFAAGAILMMSRRMKPATKRARR